MAELIGMSDEVKGHRFEIKDGDLTIGRVDDNSISIDNGTVSSHHCRVTRSNRTFTLTDLGSTNGTRVNGQDIQEVMLKPNDLVQVGSVEFVVELDAGEIEADLAVATSETQLPTVKEEAGVSKAPESFTSISPFGARKNSKGPWYMIITLVGILALLAVIYVFYKLVTTS